MAQRKSSEDAAEFHDCLCEHETDKAILVHIPDLDRSIWIPKVCVHDDSEVYTDGDHGMLAIKLWFAEKEHLV